MDATATRPWDKLVVADSYAEFRLQAQNFNPDQQYRTYGELVHQVPGAEQLPFLVSGAVRQYVQQLGGWVPDVADNQGRLFLRFTRFQFELINSDLRDFRQHQVAVTFFPEPLLWHATLGNYLLVSSPTAPAAAEIPTTLFQLQPFLSIHSLQAVAAVADDCFAR